MEFQKIVHFLYIISDNKDLPKFVTVKWIGVYDQSQGNYVNKEIRMKTSMLKSDLCDFSDAYIVVTGNIAVTIKTFTADDFEDPNNTAANATVTLLIMQIIMHLLKKSWFLKIMHHLLIVLQRLMAKKLMMRKT